MPTHVSAAIAFLVLSIVGGNAAVAASHIVELKSARGEGGSSQIAICGDDVDCLMAIKVLSPPIGASIVIADIMFTSKDVKVRFTVNGINLYD